MILLRLRSPHTVRLIELGGLPDGPPNLALELLRGESLRQRLERGPVPWRDGLAITRAICASIAEAHALGLVHRDRKPTNINLDPSAGSDSVTVLDFEWILHGPPVGRPPV